jgi:hypothetical protein
VNVNLKDRTRNDYLSYKITSAQLNQVTDDLRAGQTDSVGHELVTMEQHPGKPGKDADVKQSSLDFLGLTDNLPSNRSWTQLERATYRRLTTPEELVTPTARHSHKGSDAYVDATEKLFAGLDTDHDGKLTEAELDAGMARADFQGADAAAVATTRRNYASLASLTKQDRDKNGISTADLETFRSEGFGRNASGTSSLNVTFTKFSARALEMKPAVPVEQEHIDPFAIRQGSAGTCMLLSTLAGDSQQELQTMFHTNDNGTINVQFKDGVKETVADLTTTERLYHASGDQGERWPGVLEMAMGEKLAAGTDKLPRTMINGVPRQQAIVAVTGQGSTTEALACLSVDQTRTMLEDELAKQAHIVADTCQFASADKAVQGLEKLKNGLVDGHAYTVLGFDAKSDMVTVRNPWHRQEWVVNPDGKDDGIFQLPLKQFYSSYGFVAYNNGTW